MYDFILQTLLMLSLGIMVYLIGRAAPRISDKVEEHGAFSFRNFEEKISHALGALPVEKIDLAVSNFLEKILRKFRLSLMKFDNSLTKHLDKFRTAKKTSVSKPEADKFGLFNGNGKQSEEKPEEKAVDNK